MRLLCRTFLRLAMCLLPANSESRHRRRLNKGMLCLSWHRYLVGHLHPPYEVGTNSSSRSQIQRCRRAKHSQEFYTQLRLRGIALVFQSLQDHLTQRRVSSSVTRHSTYSTSFTWQQAAPMRQRPTSIMSTVLNLQLGLFIALEKKNTHLQLGTAVGEVAFVEDTNACL
jgi:hypothetical protein